MGRLTLCFGVFGLVCTAIIFVSQGAVGWPLLLPFAAFVGSVFVPRLAAVAMCAWCCVTFVGFLMAPCAIGMVAGARGRPV